MSERSLSVLVHGPSKAGKSTLANTAPAPRLMMDVEAAARFLPGKKVYWDPMNPKTPKPPKADGTWETCVVVTDSYEVALKTYDWLKSGKHDFRSVILDSISELQAKIQEAVNSRNKMQIQHWGELGSKLAFFCRDLRDLTGRPDSPIDAVVITAMSKESEDGHVKPFLQGQTVNQLPYWFDVAAYLYVDNVEDDEGNDIRERFLLVEPMNNILAGNRVGGRLPEIIEAPNVADMINAVFGEVDGEDEEEYDEQYEDSGEEDAEYSDEEEQDEESHED